MRFSNPPLLTAALGAVLWGAANLSGAAASANTPSNIAMFSSLQGTGSYNQRKEIYGSLSKDDQINYWVQKLNTFRSNHEDLSEDQHRVLDGAVEVIKTQDKNTAGDVEQEMNDAFGFEKAKKLVSTFYLEDEDEEEATLEQRAGSCSCSVASDYCDWREECSKGGCGKVESDCGFANMFDCDGVCVG